MAACRSELDRDNRRHANNTYRADFIYENLTVQNNIIHGTLKAGVKDPCFLGSSCI